MAAPPTAPTTPTPVASPPRGVRSLSRASWKRASVTVRLPWAAGLVTFTVIAACAFLFVDRQQSGAGLSQEVLDAQEHLTMDMARAVQGSIAEGLADLDAVAGTVTDAPGLSAEDALDALGSRPLRWDGVALVDPGTRQVLATRGRPLSPNTVRAHLRDGLPRVGLTGQPGRMGLVAYAPLEVNGRRLLVAAVQEPQLSCPRPGSRAPAGPPVPGTPRGAQCQVVNQGNAWLMDGEGRVVTGTTAYPSGRLAQRLIDIAHAAVRDANPNAVLGALTPLGQEVISYAPVARDTDAHPLGLTLVTIRTVTGKDTAGVDRRIGQEIGLRLGLLTLLVFGLLYVGLVHPIISLQRDALRLANGDERLHRHRPWLLALEENRHTAYALQLIRRQLALMRLAQVRGESLAGRMTRDERLSPAAFYGIRLPRNRLGEFIRSLRPSVLWPWSFGLVVLLTFAFSLPLAVRAGEDEPQVPALALSDQQSRLVNVAESVRRGLNESVEDLALTARLVEGHDARTVEAALRRLDEHHVRYAGLYHADAQGTVRASVGEAPKRVTGELPRTLGLVQPNRSGTVPLVYAFTPLRDGGVLVGQYDARRLNAYLQRGGLGSLWLVNADRKILASNHGIQAFDELPSRAYRDAAGQALAGHTGAVVQTIDGKPTLISWTPVAGNGPAGELSWALVSARPVSRLALAPFQLQREALMLTAVTGTATVLIFGWLYILVVRPWRQAARAAKRLANGDLKRELYPERLDEIGLAVRALERLRISLRAARGMSTGHRFADPRENTD